jgi:lysophospholipase L1-like esterase
VTRAHGDLGGCRAALDRLEKLQRNAARQQDDGRSRFAADLRQAAGRWGTPYAGHYSVAKEQLRQEVNNWIRNEADFDSVVDFDALLRDPSNPRRLKAIYDSGDHLHPGDAGYQAMAEAVDIATLVRPAAHPAQHTQGRQR